MTQKKKTPIREIPNDYFVPYFIKLSNFIHENNITKSSKEGDAIIMPKFHEEFQRLTTELLRRLEVSNG